ncbi:beta-lactamase/transpeptidase-like protein [Artomyces pyxidatus]|uniref:Beta-lactamase/transpeptidase-like protein n=1 Tax=Artomyces pyxidatus TaxID=48021 RepID=A0ACB8T4Z2_9AGAM|nr:beta-lactamase/transpeptidase-like protein [Artomyces pyxidatus]
MMRLLYGLRLVTLFAISSALFNPTSDQQPLAPALPSKDGQILTPNIVEYIGHVVENQQVPGLTVAVIRADGSSEYGAWGKKTEDGYGMTIDTLFDIGSCSKAFLSAAMGILIDDYAHGRNVTPLPTGLKKLDWDTKLKDILPGEWALMDHWASEKANLVDILSHVSGLPRHDLSYGPTNTSATVVKNLRNLRPAFELREQWSYNNQMYMVGAHIIATLTGSFTKFVDDRIFKPLNMMDSTYLPDVAHASGKTTQTWTLSGRRIPWWFTEDWQVDLIAGPGGVISSVQEMEKWVRMLLNNGVDPRTNNTILPRSAFESIVSAHSIIPGNPFGFPGLSFAGYGLGWIRTTFMGHDIIQHPGDVPGSFASVLAALADGVGVVVLANANSEYAAADAISVAILRGLFGLKDGFSLEAPSLADLRVAPSAANHTSRSYGVSNPSYNYTGTYFNKGYGTTVLCDTSSSSNYCSRVLANFSAVDSVSPSQNHSLELFTEFPSLWSSHARLTHVKENMFSMSVAYLFPEGYGKNKTPFAMPSTGEPLSVIFLVEDGNVVGFGMVGTVLEGLTLRQKEGGSIKHTADAWFHKLS